MKEGRLRNMIYMSLEWKTGIDNNNEIKKIKKSFTGAHDNSERTCDQKAYF